MCKIWQYVAMISLFLFVLAGLTTGRYYMLYHQAEFAAQNESGFTHSVQDAAQKLRDRMETMETQRNFIKADLQEAQKECDRLKKMCQMFAERYSDLQSKYFELDKKYRDLVNSTKKKTQNV